MTECPSCGDMLVGFSVREAMEHLSTCCREQGWYVLGVKPKYADELYKGLTGEQPPQMSQAERVKYYWNERIDDENIPEQHSD